MTRQLTSSLSILGAYFLTYQRVFFSFLTRRAPLEFSLVPCSMAWIPRCFILACSRMPCWPRYLCFVLTTGPRSYFHACQTSSVRFYLHKRSLKLVCTVCTQSLSRFWKVAKTPAENQKPQRSANHQQLVTRRWCSSFFFTLDVSSSFLTHTSLQRYRNALPLHSYNVNFWKLQSSTIKSPISYM